MKKRVSFYGLIILLAFGLTMSLPLWAQDTGSDSNTSVDELFSGEDTVETPTPTTTQATNPVSDALSLGKVRVGGSITGTIGPTFAWSEPWTGGSSFFSPEKSSLDFGLKSMLYVDARPVEDFRFHGSVKTNWASPPASLASDPDQGKKMTTEAGIFELFADFSVGDSVFFRFGKSTVKWGVGYFWSPADVINLTPINVFAPTTQREGPVNFQATIPIKGTQNNIYLLTVLDESDLDFDTTALAARGEFLVGNYELGAGLYYRNDTAERAMATVTGPLGNFDVFGEAMVSRGSAKSFVTSITTSPPYVLRTRVEDNRDNLYFSATAGLLYADLNNNLTIAGQYFYNGEGYSNEDRTSLINNAQEVIDTLNNMGQTALSETMKQALTGAILGSGRHYIGATVSKSQLFTDKFSASITAIANLSDLSGMVRPSIGWDVTDYFTVNLSSIFFFGSQSSEYGLGSNYQFGGYNGVSLSLSGTLTGSF